MSRTPPIRLVPFIAWGVLGLLVAFGRLPWQVFALVLILSAVAFATYAYDKSAAGTRGQRRVPEKSLHALGLLGGWPGALLAQQVVRHKTRKREFQIVFWITVVLNSVVLIWLSTPGGAPLREQIAAWIWT